MPVSKVERVHIDRSAVLPDDLIALGFRLVFYETKMVAVSNNFGCSQASAMLAEVVRSARDIASFCSYMNTKKGN